MPESVDSVSRLPEAETIVVGVDGTPESDAAVDWSIRESLASGRRILLVHVSSIPENLAAGFLTLFGAEDPSSYPDELLERYASQCREAGTPVSTAVAEGSTSDVLSRAAREAAMLVIGTSVHTAAEGFAKGSPIEGVLRRAECPVVVVKKGLHRETSGAGAKRHSQDH